jgi:hypothetical protein
MRRLLLMIVATALASCASGAPKAGGGDAAAGPAPAEKTTTTTAAITGPDDPGYWDEVICRREPVTGTRLTRARCHSRYDWARMRGAATETMRDIQSQPVPCRDGAGCGGD